MTVEGSVDSDLSERFVRGHLAPKLRPDVIVVWDNHSVHKRPELCVLIEGRGAELVWQPRYSPEFNAVEELWSKVKHLVRRARADTAAALTEALAAAVGSLTWEDSLGWLRHAGYQIRPSAYRCMEPAQLLGFMPPGRGPTRRLCTTQPIRGGVTPTRPGHS